MTAGLLDVLLWPSVLLLLLAPWPLWRLLAVPAFRRGRRGPAALLGSAGLALLALLLLLAFEFPAALPPLGLAAGAAMLYACYRSRPGYGRAQGLPPGRLGLLPAAPLREEGFYREASERYGPIFKMGSAPPYLTWRPMVCLTDAAGGQALLRRYDASLAPVPVIPFNRNIPRGFLRYMAPEDHRRTAGLFHRAFAALDERALDRLAVAEARRLLLAMAEAGAGGKGVAPRPLLQEMAFACLARLLFGLEAGSAAFRRLEEDCAFLAFSRARRFWRGPARQQRYRALLAFLGEEVAGQPHCVLAELERLRSGSGRDPTLLGNLLVMQVLGASDLAGLLTWVVKFLSESPAWLERLRQEGALPAGRGSLAEQVVRETLRLEQSEFILRRTLAPIEIGSYRIPAGWTLRICIRESHRDPAKFVAPDRFDPARFAGAEAPGAPSYAPFGLFRHHCVGAQASLAIGRNLAQVLARDFSLTVVDDGPREHPLFHWEPSRRFRIVLARREGPQAERVSSEAI